MQILYGIFYTVLSIGILMVFLFPVMLLLRFITGRQDKKMVMWQWRLLFLRSICPISLSSLLCMTPSVNRRYHIWLSLLGLKIKNTTGVMNSWMAVFTNEISVTRNFRICSILWAAGAVVVGLSFVLPQKKLCRALGQATEIGEGIYESSLISSPVMLGVFQRKIIVPKGFRTKDLVWLISHMQQRKKEQLARVGIGFCVAVHWFNPVMWIYFHFWSADVETAADEKVWRAKALKQRAMRVLMVDEKNSHRKNRAGMLYAQSILNFCQDNTKQPKQRLTGFLTVTETNTGRRAKRMMYKEKESAGGSIAQILLTIVFATVLFLLVPLRILWLGGVEKRDKTVTNEEPLFEEKETVVVSKVSTTSSQGLECVVQLEWEGGQDKGEAGFDGSFVLKLYDNAGNKMDERTMDEIFTTQKKESYHFSSGLSMIGKDYNGNGAMEFVLGQKKTVTQEEFETLLQEDSEDKGAEIRTKEPLTVADYDVFSYAVLEVGKDGFVKAGDNILTTGKTGTLRETRVFDTLEGISDIFTTQVGETTVYYEWNEENSCYEKRQFTEEELEAKRKTESEQTEGQIKEHTLEDDNGKVAVRVSAQIDDTGSEEITSVILYPKQEQQKFEDVKGYFCDLMWAPALAQEEKKYALLIYNGSSSQTFILYDVADRKVYYRQEDGAKELETVFADNGDKDITFQEKGAVLYDLVEKREDVLEITFVAEADGKITVKGSYEYNVKQKKYANLTFTRVIKETGDEEKAAPTPEPFEEKKQTTATAIPTATPTFEEEVDRLFERE